MATTVKTKKLLHRKNWELCTPSFSVNQAQVTTSGSFVTSDKFNLIPDALAFFVAGASGILRYDGNEDAWMQLPNSGATGSFAAGSCGEFRGLSAMGGTFTQTATAGSVTTITTNRNIVRSLTGRRIRVVAGAGMGYEGTIDKNTVGSNSLITVTPASAVAFDATTQFQVYSGSLWFFNAGTVAVGFTVYDLATNAWTARSVTGLPTAWGTDGRLTSTLGSIDAFATGTATAGAASTLTDGARTWLTNQWANYQIRITAGTGKGQIRAIASNAATVITTSAAWTINPDATSVYAIEGNDDSFYLIGNNAVPLYRFTVSTNTWATLAPTAARAGVAGAGASLNWIDSVDSPLWTLTVAGSPNTIASTPLYAQKGRYLFSFRGGATNTLDIYDIAANTWISGVAYGNQFDTFSTGTSDVDYKGRIYIQKEATSRISVFDIGEWCMKSFSAVPNVQGTTLAGQKMFVLPYTDGGTEIDFLYTQRHSFSDLYRIMMI
jgi:hypothetical protein